jgi:hypothetical protein
MPEAPCCVSGFFNVPRSTESPGGMIASGELKIAASAANFKYSRKPSPPKAL